MHNQINFSDNNINIAFKLVYIYILYIYIYMRFHAALCVFNSKSLVMQGIGLIHRNPTIILYNTPIPSYIHVDKYSFIDRL